MHLSSFICIFFKKKKANVNFCHPAPICRHPGAGWDPLRRRHFSCHPAARAPRDVSRGWMQTPGPRLINSSRSDTNRCCLCCRTGHQFTWIPRSSRGMTSKENAGHRGQPAHHKNIRFCGGTTRRGMTNKKNTGAARHGMVQRESCGTNIMPPDQPIRIHTYHCIETYPYDQNASP